MASEQDKKNLIALNVTRTRVTVLVFNLTIIALMFSILKATIPGAEHVAAAHITTSVPLFMGFCLTLQGLLLLLASQNLDAEGMSRPFLFTLGSITTYLALSQTITAFMHEYLVAVESTAAALRPGVAESLRSLVRNDALGDAALLIIFVMAGGVWILITYVGPLSVGLRSPVRRDLRWVFAGYYFTLQVPIYWVYARAWHLQFVTVDQPTNLRSLFALQFVQPLLWFR